MYKVNCKHVYLEGYMPMCSNKEVKKTYGFPFFWRRHCIDSSSNNCLVR